MLGYLLSPAEKQTRKVPLPNLSSRRETTVLSVQILPDGTSLDGAFVYARKEDCAFDLNDLALYSGFNAHAMNRRPRVSFDLVEGRAVNVRLVQ